MIKSLSNAILLVLTLCTFGTTANAQDAPCASLQDQQALDCAMSALDLYVPQINNVRWRDQSLREQAKILVRKGDVQKALTLISQITNADTQALTIRAIGIGMKDLTLDDAQKTLYFDALHKHATAITHTGSQEIALTYIAIAEASAGLFQNALKTASKLETRSLRNKSYQEIAEVLSATHKSDDAFFALERIDDTAFKNKAYSVVAAVFIKHQHITNALKATDFIDDPYIKSSSLLHIINTAELPAATKQAVQK
jgi:predicted negative regulator of RcsB-dependent stress response